MECKSNKKVLVSVCNAVLDVSTTWIGRAKLCQAFAVQKLISVFLQDDATSKHVVQYYMEKGSSELQEKSPFLFTKLSKPLNDCGDSFSSLFRSFSSKRTTNAIISSMLGGLVSCPPLPSDDLDIISFLEEVKGGLGFPMIYEQDIRVLKSVDMSNTKTKREIHYHKELTDSTVMPDHNMVDVHKCEKAFLEGYTVALRGMEFRSETIAAIADGLAVLFGQPSVGANATSPHLSLRVWLGTMMTTVCLPASFLDKRDDGLPETDDVSTGSSLHLTLGIEIEPPFGWEGFAHVALHCWNQKQQANPCINQLLGVQEKNEELFQRMRWLHHLDHEGEADEGFDWNYPLKGFENLLHILYENKEDAEARFTLVKSNFCKAVVFENVCESFEILLLKYKRTRK
ncbi:hypothetical protein C5167_015498 [Papaver somniferum]|uniref:Bifunctional lysine-specific demethylase and histidyl-hydroxylase n=1 Tax=Papaver somniferum TaxID=3469 RepID=A0A4Y7JA50_PAPSO|nr:hypothetical protein C5167_015498 [Papaver somniferum]